MTALVVVMNRTAVAMAADGAVTIPYEKGTKHYHGVTKVMRLHGTEPVGIMFFGTPDFLGMPWEVIIDDFRARHGRKRKSITAYGRALFDYVASSFPEWASPTIAQDRTASTFAPLLDAITTTWERRQREPGLTADTAPAALDAIVDAEIQRWTNDRPGGATVLDGDLPPLPAHLVTDALDAYEGWPERLSETARTQIGDAAAWSLRRLWLKERYLTGLVIAGFPRGAPFPSVQYHYIGAPISEQLRCVSSPLQSVSADREAIVIPFGEQDAMKLFLTGMDRRLKLWVEEVFDRMSDPVEATVLRAQLDSTVFDRSLSIIRSVAHLPRSGLARFAGTLVDHTAFSLEMSMTPETVGKPIDVAVLSRADGFVWVERAHYYRHALNRHLGDAAR